MGGVWGMARCADADADADAPGVTLMQWLMQWLMEQTRALCDSVEPL